MGDRIQVFKNDEQLHDFTIYAWEDAPEEYRALLRSTSDNPMYVFVFPYPRYQISWGLAEIIGDGLHQYLSHDLNYWFDSYDGHAYVLSDNLIFILTR